MLTPYASDAGIFLLMKGNYLHLIYPNKLEVKDTTDTLMSASDLDLHLEIDRQRKKF
jgi:hypothetical protein